MENGGKKGGNIRKIGGKFTYQNTSQSQYMSHQKNFLSKQIAETVSEDGIYHDTVVSGFFLRVRKGYGNFCYRRTIKGKRYEINLGTRNKVNFVDARKKASLLSILDDAEFLDSTNQKKKDKSQQIKEELTFAQVAQYYIDWNLSVGKWVERDKQHRVALSRLKCHVLPIIGDKKFTEIDCNDISKVAIPIWSKLETVNRTLRLVKTIFDWGKAKAFTKNDNPADRNGPLKFLLPSERFIATNLGALPVSDLPDFMRTLYENLGDSTAFRCGFLEVLTATRSKTIREAKWSQFDFEKKEWVIPPSQLKVSENGSLIVPLCDKVIDYIKTIPKVEGIDLMFPNPDGNVMSDTMISRIVCLLPGKWIDKELSLKKEKEIRATMHGIAKATFLTWSQDDSLGNDKKFDSRIAELCLHHKINGGYNGAYERNKSIIRRREMMEAWADYCFSKIDL